MYTRANSTDFGCVRTTKTTAHYENRIVTRRFAPLRRRLRLPIGWRRAMKTPQILTVFLLSLFLLLVLIPLDAQSANIIEVQPASGPPGTTIVVRDVVGNRGKTCFVSIAGKATSIGQMAGSITYVV